MTLELIFLFASSRNSRMTERTILIAFPEIKGPQHWTVTRSIKILKVLLKCIYVFSFLLYYFLRGMWKLTIWHQVSDNPETNLGQGLWVN